MTNHQIVEYYLDNNLLRVCVDCQFANQKSDMQFKDDFFQDLILILLKYDNQKLNDAHLHNHFNALVSKIIINNLWSKSSSFYKTYKRFSERSDEITEELENSLVDE